MDLDIKPELDIQSEEKVEKPSDADEFSKMPAWERAVKGPTALAESLGRGLVNFGVGTGAKTIGTIKGALETGTMEGAVAKGKELEDKYQIPPQQKGSAYFDEHLIGPAVEAAREQSGNLMSMLGEDKIGHTPEENLRQEAASRSMGEGAFDEAMVAGLFPKRGRAKGISSEEHIRPGLEGPQAELDLRPEGQEFENATPSTVPQDEAERLSKEIDLMTKEGNPQGELFSDYNPVDKFKLEDSQGGGRFKAPDMSEQVTSSMYTKDGLGGATEQSNFSADKYSPRPNGPAESIPYDPHTDKTPIYGPKNQRGVMDLDLLTLGVSKLLKSDGFKKTMEKFRGTFSDVSIDDALRNSEDPKSRHTIIFMPPEKFLELAKDRKVTQNKYAEEFVTDSGEKQFRSGEARRADQRRESIRQGIKGKGLNDIPSLLMTAEHNFKNGSPIHEIIGHEGRHRADVFQEQGLDLMPVRVTHSDMRWGNTHPDEFPKGVITENKKYTDFPEPENWKAGNDLDFTDKFTNKGKHGQAGFINLNIFKKTQKDKGTAQTVLDARKQFMPYKQNLKQMMQDEGINAKGLTDLSDKFKAASNALIDKSMSILTEGKGDVGKFVKWTVDQITGSDRKSELTTESDLWGEGYKKGTGGVIRPFDKRVATKDGILTNWKEARKTKEGKLELIQMLRKAKDNIGTDLEPKDFKTTKQFQIYDAVQKGFKNILERLNDAREKSKMGPIDRLPGYFPSKFEGDYRVHMYDGLGNKVRSEPFSNKWQADRAVKTLREAHPDLDVRDAEHVKLDKTQIGDLSAFEEYLRTNAKDDPRSIAIQKTLVELRGQKGFGRHSLQKKGVGGYLGSEGGDLGVRNMERSIEQYVRQANRYISNLEKAKIESQLDNLPKEMRDRMPNALDYMKDYIHNSRGADMDRMSLVSDMFKSLSRIGGLGESAPGNFLRQASSAASLYFLTTPRFVVSQMVQHMNAFPKYVQLAHEGTFRNPIASWWKGWEHFIKPDDLAREGTNWAQRNGFLDSAMVAMLEMKLGDVVTERAGIVKDAVSYGMGQIEKKLVRMPTFMAFEYGLRDSIKDPIKRYETAANMMDYYMVHYSRTGSPMMYAKAGLVGESARAFKQYSHNGWAQLFEYMGYANKESIGPLLTHIAVQTSMAGLKGAPLVAEAAAGVALLNMVLSRFDVQVPDPQDLLMNSNLPDLFVFGGLSTALGRDISSSVNAPNIPQMFSAPAVQFVSTAVKDGGNYLLNKLAGVDTERDQYKAALALAPAAMRGFIEELYSKDGQPVPKSGSKNMEGNYVRDQNEKTWAEWSSTKSVPEARTNAMISAIKQNLAQDMNARISSLDAIVDRLQSGGELDDKLIERFVSNGGDVNTLLNTVVKRAQERSMDFADRQTYNKNLTPNQVHKLDQMKYLLDKKSGGQRQDLSEDLMQMSPAQRKDITQGQVYPDSKGTLGTRDGINGRIQQYDKFYNGLGDNMDKNANDAFDEADSRSRQFKDIINPKDATHRVFENRKRPPRQKM